MTFAEAKTIADSIVAACAVVSIFPALAFPPYYHFKSRGAWMDSAVGKHIMSWSTVMAGLYISAIIRWFIPEEFLHVVVRPLIAVGCAIVVWQRFVIFRRILNEPQAPEELAALPRSVYMAEQEPQAAVEVQSTDSHPLTEEQVRYVCREASGCDDADPFEDSDSFREVPNAPERSGGSPTG